MLTITTCGNFKYKVFMYTRQRLFIWNYLAMSNIIDGYCVYRCAQEIKRSTEETREMTSKTAYINRKRYS